MSAEAAFDQDTVNRCELYLRQAYNDGIGDPARNGEWALIDACAPSWRTVMDVGACVGDWSLRVLAANPAAEVHCFEPFPPNVAALHRRLGDRAQIVPMALGAEESELHFHIAAQAGAGANLGSLYPQGPSGPEDSLKVAVIPLTDYCDAAGIERIDCLKIDAEGAEMAILEGALPLFRQGRIGLVQFEYGGTWIAARRYLKDVFDLLVGCNYRVGKLMQTGYRPVSDYFVEMETFRQSNWLLLHASAEEPAHGGLIDVSR